MRQADSIRPALGATDVDANRSLTTNYERLLTVWTADCCLKIQRSECLYTHALYVHTWKSVGRLLFRR